MASIKVRGIISEWGKIIKLNHMTQSTQNLWMNIDAKDFYNTNNDHLENNRNNDASHFLSPSLNFPRFITSPTVLISVCVPNLHSALFSGGPQPSISPSHPSPYVAGATFSFSSSPPSTCATYVSRFPTTRKPVTWWGVSSVKTQER